MLQWSGLNMLWRFLVLLMRFKEFLRSFLCRQGFLLISIITKISRHLLRQLNNKKSSFRSFILAVILPPGCTKRVQCGLSPKSGKICDCWVNLRWPPLYAKINCSLNNSSALLRCTQANVLMHFFAFVFWLIFNFYTMYFKHRDVIFLYLFIDDK